jgi:hypothetical protein
MNDRYYWIFCLWLPLLIMAGFYADNYYHPPIPTDHDQEMAGGGFFYYIWLMVATPYLFIAPVLTVWLLRTRKTASAVLKIIGRLPLVYLLLFTVFIYIEGAMNILSTGRGISLVDIGRAVLFTPLFFAVLILIPGYACIGLTLLVLCLRDWLFEPLSAKQQNGGAV